MNTIGVGASVLEFGPDNDPDQGYRVRVRTFGGMEATVWLDARQLADFAAQVADHQKQQSRAHRCQFCRAPISRWRWWLRGAMCSTCGVRVGMGGAPRIRR